MLKFYFISGDLNCNKAETIPIFERITQDAYDCQLSNCKVYKRENGLISYSRYSIFNNNEYFGR